MSPLHPDIEALVARLKAADVAYFTTGEVLMDDLAYDNDKATLRQLCPDHPYLKQVGSPVEHTPLQKVEHKIPMGSLDKAMTRDEFFKWVEKTAKALGVPPTELVLNATFKADGGSYSAEYNYGRLVRVLTRGDGKTGEDVTLNGQKFKGLPVKTNIPFHGLVRFEGVLHVDDWATIDPEQLSNPRNVANGLGRRKSAEQAEYITAYGFRLHNIDGTPAGGSTEYDGHQALATLGFVPVPGCVHSNAYSIWEWVEEIGTQRKNLPFWIDGIVVTVNSRGQQVELGEATDCPRWAVAIKFPAETATTVIRSVEITVGHTGAIIPTAKFDTVRLGGTNVASALLCNWDLIEALDVAVGDTVEVYKAGEIIPRILRVTHRPADRKPIPRPTSCPVCGGPVGHKKTVDGEDSAIIYCLSDDCGAKVFGKLARFLQSLDIQGIGDEILAVLVRDWKIKTPGDLYRLIDKGSALWDLPLGAGRVGARALTITKNLEAKKVLTLSELLGSLGIEGLGKRRVAIVQDKLPGEFDTIEDWLGGKLLVRAADAGLPNSAKRIHESIVRSAPVIRDLLEAGVTITAPVAKTPVKVGAKSFCMTGKLSKPREEWAKEIEAKGHVVKDSVAKGLDYLVMADPNSGSSKAQKAAKLGVRCIDEAGLASLLNA